MIGFKIIDFIRGTNIVSTYKYLLRIQFSGMDYLELISKRSIIDLWKIAKDLPYYREYNDFNDIPILNKSLIRKNYESLLNYSVKKKDWIKKKTGGSTGEPLTYYTGKDSQSFLWAGILLSWHVAGWRPGQKMAFLAGNSLFGKGLIKRMYFRLMNVTAFDAFDLSKMKMERYLDYLNQQKILFLYGYAYSIYFFALHNMNSSRKIRLKAVITTAENLTNSMREVIEKSFSCEVFNQYGCNDAGLSAFECNEHNGFHIINVRAYVEEIDGVLISTDTKNVVMPMLRYDTGDRGELNYDKCQCGRGFPRIKQINGRSNDSVVNLKTNALVHSSVFNFIFKEYNQINTFQVTFNKDTLKVNFQLGQKCILTSKDLDFLKIQLNLKTGYDLISFVFNEPLIKEVNGKVRPVIQIDNSTTIKKINNFR